MATRTAAGTSSLIDRRRYDDEDEEGNEYIDLPDDNYEEPYFDGRSRIDIEDGDPVITFDSENLPTDSIGYQPDTDEESEDEEPEEDDGHDENLAEYISESELNLMADEILDMIAADEESMEPWRRKMEMGLRIMGITQPTEGELPFNGAATMTHPMISEATVQFNARAYQEIMPPTGPCKGKVEGDETDEKREQADRVEDHMNHQLTVEDEGYAEEIDQLLFYLPLAGSAFTKTYHDPTLMITTSRFIRAESMVIPYTATSLANSPRYGERIFIERNEMRKRMASGMYRDIDLVDPEDEGGETNEDELVAYYSEAEGRERSWDDDDPRHTVYEEYIEWDLPGFEDKDKRGRPTGIALPYIITIDYRSRRILSIYRNWRRDDAFRRKRRYHTHWKYLPGLGMLGFGLIHHIGGLADACTGSVRALLDSAAFATLQGGFKAKEARLKSGTITLTPGVWEDVDLTAEELQKAFYTPPFKEPSTALFELLKIMEENGRRFAGTTEAVVGDATNSGPVGTTVALIEQGTKVMSGIHRRLHRAQADEFRIRAEVNAETLPEGYIYYDTAGGHKYITADDYSNRQVSVVPVSDPNIVSATQRIAISQAMKDLATENPTLYKPIKVHTRLLEDLGVDNPDEYLVDDQARYRFDPVSEGSRLMAQKPIHAFLDQNHEAHIAVHMAQIDYYRTLPPDQATVLIMAMTEHLAKHEGYRVYQMVSQQALQLTGQPLPTLDLYDDDPDNQMPPEVENAVTEQVSRFVGQLLAQAQQMAMQQQTQNNPEMMKAQAEEDRKQKAFDADESRKQMAWENEESRKAKSIQDKQEANKPDPEQVAREREDKDFERKNRTRELDQRDRELDIADRDSKNKGDAEMVKAMQENPEAFDLVRNMSSRAKEEADGMQQRMEQMLQQGAEERQQSAIAAREQSEQLMKGFMQGLDTIMQQFAQSMQQMGKSIQQGDTRMLEVLGEAERKTADALASLSEGQAKLAQAVEASANRKMPAIDFIEDEEGKITGFRPVNPERLDQGG